MSIRFTSARAAGALIATLGVSAPAAAWDRDGDDGRVSHVLLISIDGMHASDFENCAKGIDGVNGGQPYCPNPARLAKHGYVYIEVATSRPSDSFPGLTAPATGDSPFSTGAFYDVSYNRELSPPATRTPYGVPGGANLCPSVVGAQFGYDEQVDVITPGSTDVNDAHTPDIIMLPKIGVVYAGGGK